MITHSKGHRPGDIVPLAKVKRWIKRGKARMAELKTDPTAQMETLKARARVLGKPSSRSALDDLRSPWWGCNAGRAMAEVADPRKSQSTGPFGDPTLDWIARQVGKA